VRGLPRATLPLEETAAGDHAFQRAFGRFRSSACADRRPGFIGKERSLPIKTRSNVFGFGFLVFWFSVFGFRCRRGSVRGAYPSARVSDARDASPRSSLRASPARPSSIDRHRITSPRRPPSPPRAPYRSPYDRVGALNAVP
jgi:hypothetical protein